MSWTTAGWPSQPNVSFSACPAVAVQSRVLPSRWFVPMPASRDRAPACSSPRGRAGRSCRSRARRCPSSRAAPASARRSASIASSQLASAARRRGGPAGAAAGRRELFGLPAVEALRPEPAVVDAVGRRGRARRRCGRRGRRCRARSRASRARTPTAPNWSTGPSTFSSTRIGQSPPRGYGVRAPHGSLIRSAIAPRDFPVPATDKRRRQHRRRFG